MSIFAAEKVILEKESLYHHIVVTQNAGLRYMKFGNSIVQSAVYIDDPVSLQVEYTKYLPLALLFKPNSLSLLTIGLGGGAVPRIIKEYLPEIQIEAVEIDPAVVEIAKKYFFLEQYPAYNIAVMDGRVYLMRSKKKFDIILLDAYNADSIPFHLTTIEFLLLVKSRLNSGGVVASNLWCSEPHLFQAMLKTFQQAFPYVYRFKVFGKNNVIIIACGQKLGRFDIVQRAADFQLRVGFPYDYVFCADQLDLSSIDLNSAKLLTDDYAPVDWLKHLKDK